MRIFRTVHHLVGGSLLIAGTTIGVGMLALPVATGPGGFFPSLAIYSICWLFMLCTGFLLVEASLWMPKETSFISMAEKILGPWGKVLFWIVYLFLFLTVMIAHAAGGGAIFQELSGFPLPGWASALIYTMVFFPVVYLGARSVDRLNLFLISGVAVCYLAFIGVSAPAVQGALLTYVNWSKAWLALPVLFTAFTYQVIIPTLMNYMERDVKQIRKAIVFGSGIPFIVYVVWQVVIMGIVPTEGLIAAKAAGENAVTPLKNFVSSSWIFTIGRYFAFFALTTSFIPLALSFFDFLADGLKWEKKGMKRAILCGAVFGVPLLIAIIYPQIFLVALGYAGGISCALLFGFMPPFLVWVGRYKKRYSSHPQLGGGKPVLAFLMLFALLILGSEIWQQFG